MPWLEPDRAVMKAAASFNAQPLDQGDQLDAVAANTAAEAIVETFPRRDDELTVVGAVVDGAVSTELIAELPETDIEHRCDGIGGDME